MDASPAAERGCRRLYGWARGGEERRGRAISASIFRRIKRARSGSGRWWAGTRFLTHKDTFQLLLCQETNFYGTILTLSWYHLKTQRT